MDDFCNIYEEEISKAKKSLLHNAIIFKAVTIIMAGNIYVNTR